jgi:glucokinase
MNMMHVIDPDVVVFAGGMTAAGEPFMERIRHHVKQLAFPVPAAGTVIRYAELGSDAGFIGAAGCGRLLVRGQPRLCGSRKAETRSVDSQLQTFTDRPE